MTAVSNRNFAMKLSCGDRLGPYRVVSLLGAGGMGEVYEAVDTRLDRLVAVKTLPRELAADERLVARFEREARAVSRLSHPNICTLHDVGQARVDGGTVHYLVLELVGGETLEEVLAQGPLDVERVAAIAAQIAAAIEVAHARGIAHRDLKPANVKVAADGQVKVLDFGLAKALEPPARESSALGLDALPTRTLGDTGGGQAIGTAGYMSPEQVRGRAVDHRADIWAFGVLLFELLAGRRPFAGTTISEALVSVLTERPDWSALPVRTPAPIRRLLERCLEPDPTQRLQAIGEARIVLERRRTVSRSAPTHPDDGPEGGFAWRHLAPWAVAGMLAVALLGMLSTQVTRSEARRPLRVPVDLAPGEALVSGGSGGSAFALSKDGSQVVYAVGSGAETRLALRPLDRIEPVDLPGTEGAASPFFSPDGTRVGFFARGELRTVALAGGAPRTIAPAPQGRGGAWGPDGTIVFAPGEASGLMRVPADGGTPEPLTERAEGERSHRWPSFLPDGRHVLFVDQRGTQDYGAAAVEAVDLETGERTRLIDGGTWPLYLADRPRRPGKGHLAFVRDGTVFVVRFDPESLEVSGTPEPVLERVASSERAFGGTGSAQVAVSLTGTLLYRSAPPAERPRTVVERSPDGEETTLLAEPRAYRFPRLSPDGDRLALVFDDAVWVVDRATGGLGRLTFDDDRALGFPVWTPDGTGIAYAAVAGSDPADPRGGEADVYVRRTDGAADARRLTAAKGAELPAAFSPDGRRLLYLAAGDGTGWDIRSVTPRRPDAARGDPGHGDRPGGHAGRRSLSRPVAGRAVARLHVRRDRPLRGLRAAVPRGNRPLAGVDRRRGLPALDPGWAGAGLPRGRSPGRSVVGRGRDRRRRLDPDRQAPHRGHRPLRGALPVRELRRLAGRGALGLPPSGGAGGGVCRCPRLRACRRPRGASEYGAVHLVLGWFDDLVRADRDGSSGRKKPRAVEGYGAGGGEGA